MKPILSKNLQRKVMTMCVLLLPFFICPRRANANMIVIKVQNYSFSPDAVICNVGDTIKWVWVAGVHTTTSTTIPAGAATWSQPINGNSPTFIYPIMVSGMYNYQCNYHYAMGMVGSFRVSPSGIAPIDMSNGIMIYPNPVKVDLTIKSPGGAGIKRISMYSISGQQVCDRQYGETGPTQDVVNCESYAEGIYVLRVELENAGTVVRKITLIK